MKLHIFSLSHNVTPFQHHATLPQIGEIITVNCGEKIPMSEPINASWDDGRICAKCLSADRARNIPRLRTFALLELEDVDLTEIASPVI